MDTGNAIREVRRRLKLTQEQVADRGGLSRTEVVKVESGANKASTYAMRAGLAMGLGLSIGDLSDLLDGYIKVQEAVARAREPRS
jgi:transcriptional regulator with XRE-family HTH domain